MAGLLQEIHSAWRLVSRTPALSIGAIAALALAVGPTTVLFSMVYAVLLKPLPYREPDRLVVLGQLANPNTRTSGVTATAYPLTTFEAINAVAALTRAFESVAFIRLPGQSSRDVMVAPSESVAVRGGMAGPDFFRVLGLDAFLGRTFVEDDATQDVVVLSHRIWRSAFGGDADIVGRDVRLDGALRTVVGVLPPNVHISYPNVTDYWVPVRPGQLLPYPFAIARLQPDITVTQATAALRTVPGLQRSGAGTLVALPVNNWMSDRVRPAMRLAVAAATLLLIAAYANVAVLLMARATRRTREHAVRAALGASRMWLLRQALVESGVIGALGVLAGVAIAFMVHPLLLRIVPAIVPRIDEMGLSLAALIYVAVVGLVCTLVVGWATHHTAVGVSLTERMAMASGSATASRKALSGRRALLAAQTMALLALLAVSGLLLHSFWRLWKVDLGFETRNLVGFQMTPWLPPGPGAEQYSQQLTQRVLAGVKSLPGVADAGITALFPLAWREGGGGTQPARDSRASEVRIETFRMQVTPGFFRLMGMGLMAGRDFSDRDAEGSPPVAVVSASLARALYGTEPAIGRRVFLGTDYEIVGIVEDARWRRPDEAMPALYRPWTGSAFLTVIARTSENPASFSTAVRRLVRSIDENQAVDFVTSMEDRVNEALGEHRFFAYATVGFGLIALLLGAIGIFAVVVASITERVREIGIRSALGATPVALLTLAMRQALVPVSIGLALGTVASFWSVRLVRSWLFEVRPTDPVTFFAAATTVLLVAIVAAWLPAMRATRIDPVDALRRE